MAKRTVKLRKPGSPKFALFGEMLLTGVVTMVLSIPVITVLPALVAGVRHLRRHAEGFDDGITTLVRDFGRIFSRMWLLGVAVAVVMGFFLVDVAVLSTSIVPGGGIVAGTLLLAAAAAAVVLLRFAGGWRDGHGVATTLRRAGIEATADLGGSLLLLVAVLAVTVVIWMFPPLAIVVGGILALSAYGIDTRLEHLMA